MNNKLSLIILFSTILTSNENYLGKLKYSKESSSLFSYDKSKLPFDPKPYKCSQLINPQNIKLIHNLNVSLQIEYDNFLHLKILDADNNNRWIVPENEVLNPKYIFNRISNVKNSSSKFKIKIPSNNKLSFSILTPNKEEIYSFSEENFLFSETLIQFESILTSNNIYGFGERYHKLKLEDGIYTIWPNDTGGIQKDDREGRFNLMGHQPIGLHKTKYENIFLGFVFVNSNMQDIIIKTNSNDNISLIYKTIGGIIDYYIIYGNSPEEVNKYIHFLLGFPTLPPFWSFGFHQSRYGYKSSKEFNDVILNYKTNKIPFDTMWIDIDSLREFEIFTINDQFSDLSKIVNNLHKENYHFIPIVDLGISYENKKNPFVKLGNELNIFIKSNYTKETLISNVWPGDTVFPDFFNPNTIIIWHYGLNLYYNLIKYDGIWLDMNEPAMLKRDHPCIGEIAKICDKKDNYYYYKDLPYIPGFRGHNLDISTGSINENAINYGDNDIKYASYNTKPLISFFHSKSTYYFLLNKLKFRPFVLTRSNFIGIGKYAFHWLGDNHSNIDDMKNSISGIFQFNIFGIPMTGDDICGFMDNANSNLCVRWHNLGVFYPFSRNHNFIHSKAQFPWSFDKNSLNYIKNAINYRYSLLRYIYSEMFYVSLNEKSGFFKPVFYTFPYDENSYFDIDERVMIGDCFILFPNFVENSEIPYNKTFPEGLWNLYPNGNESIKSNDTDRRKNLSGKYKDINIFLRGGCVVPFQDTFDNYIRNSYVLRNRKLNLMINLNDYGEAKGEIFYDNDERFVIENENYWRVSFKYEKEKLFVNTNKNNLESYSFKDNILEKIIILNIKNVNNNTALAILNNGTSYNIEGNYDSQFLKITYIIKNIIQIEELKEIIFNYKNEK